LQRDALHLRASGLPRRTRRPASASTRLLYNVPAGKTGGKIRLFVLLPEDQVEVGRSEAIAREGWSLDTFSAIPHNRNLQLRHLLLGSPDADPAEPELTREHLEEGKRRLRRFWFVGLTESFEQDSHYLYGKLGFRTFHTQRVVNATPEKERVPPALRRAIAERNALDLELYEYARELRREFVDRHPLDLGFHRRKALVTRAVETRLDRLRQRGPAATPSR
jgi:hypothetical protein